MSPSHAVQQLAKKVNNVETSWALGATFDYFRNLNIHWGALVVTSAGTERDNLSPLGFPSSIHPPSTHPLTDTSSPVMPLLSSSISASLQTLRGLLKKKKEITIFL